MYILFCNNSKFFVPVPHIPVHFVDTDCKKGGRMLYYILEIKGSSKKEAPALLQTLFEKKEKKVEYLELIYDLIFVYIIGRNNSLLHHLEDGFLTWDLFLPYLLCTLAVIQIWMYSTYYINLYGRHSVREHVFLFVNMFLLYFIAEGTRLHWQSFHTQYHATWALILLNIALQYLIEMLQARTGEEKRLARRMMLILLAEASLVVGAIPVFLKTGLEILSPAAILFGIAATSFAGGKKARMPVDFPHLSERVMLFVVFTFGEMIIAIASYFDGTFNARSLFFSLMGFLIVVGLFLSYGVVYDHIIDREKETDGLRYTLVHVGLIFVLNNITCALEFMQNEKIALLPKMLFLVGSLVFYYVFLFMISSYAKTSCHLSARFLGGMALLAASFAALMLLLREQMTANIAVTVVYVFSVFLVLYRAGRRMDARQTA